MEKWKTIKQISDELGVSKQAVRDKIAKLGLHGTLRKNANQLCISKEQEILIKSVFSENKSQSKTAKKLCENDKQSQTNFQLIAMLQKELDVKNKQIDELNSRLAEAHKMAEQAQQLHGVDKTMQLIESQEPKMIEQAKEKKRWMFWL